MAFSGPLGLSLFIHLLLLGGLSLLPLFSPSKLSSSKNVNVFKIKTVGVARGKESFQMLLSSLRPSKPTLSDKAVLNSVPSRVREISLNDVLSRLFVPKRNLQILKQSQFDLAFEPPRGVGEDELNSQEKVYYSFQKRAFLSYLHSFLKVYQSLALEKPSMVGVLQNGDHFLSGRIVFDSQGNAQSVKIFQSSPDDSVHLLFERTLTQIRGLPNPPQSFLKDRDEFALYYQLKINSQNK